jgi:hypothetical protein
VKHSEYILNELKEISPLLAEIEKINVYTVPENYFTGLYKQILEKAKNATPAILPASDTNYFASETHFLDVPQGYFDNLAGNILKKIKSLQTDNAGEELKQLSPMLYAVQNENIFSVPAGYFDTLPGTILHAIQPPTQAKVVAFKKRSQLWNYAIAAMLTGVMAVSALWITNKPFNLSPVISEVKNIPSYVLDASQFKNEQQLNEGIASLSDDEIIKYLEVTGTNADDDVLATSIPEKELPAQQDYLLDEKTLDTYLDRIDLKNNED